MNNLEILLCINSLQLEGRCAVRIRHIFSSNEYVQQEQDTSLVQMRMSSTSEAHLKYECGCAERVRYVFTTNMKYEQGISSVLLRMCSM